MSRFIPNAKKHSPLSYVWQSKPYSQEQKDKEKAEADKVRQKYLDKKLSIESKELNTVSFKDLYQFPFRQCDMSSWVYDANSNFIFQFVFGGEKLRNKVIQILNGELEEHSRREVKHESGYIKVKVEDEWHDFILIRGWGMMTGIGGYNLDGEYAGKIQDTLAEYIVEKLNT